MSTPLMPKATAVWLIDNTSLSFEQIGDFCVMHPLEVQAVADGDVATGIIGRDPIAAGELTREEIARCESDPSARLKIISTTLPRATARSKGPRYTPVAKRHDKPNGIAWIVRHHPELPDSVISKLLGTTKSTIQSVRDRTHWNTPNIKAQHPVDLGLCTYTELNAAVEKVRARLAKAGTPVIDPPVAAEPAGDSGFDDAAATGQTSEIDENDPESLFR